MAPTRDLGKMSMVPYGKGPFNSPNTHLESQTAIMAVDTLEVEPLAMIPLARGQLGTTGALSNLQRGRPTLSWPSSHSRAASQSLMPRIDLQNPLSRSPTPKGLPRANW
jgi:hypothetical protein